MFIEFSNLTIPQVLDSAVKKNPENEAFVFGETRDTFQQFQGKVEALAAGLQRYGIQRGDKVGINLPTCAENVYAFFALFKVGAAFVPLNPDLRSFEMKHILGDSRAKAVITVGELRGFDYLTMFDEIQVDLPDFKTIFAWGARTKNGAVLLSDLFKTDPKSLNQVKVSPEDIACILYTSGTTGLPKGTVHTHNKVLNKFSISQDWVYKNSTQTRLTPMPLFNAAGVDITIQTILKGDKLVLMHRFNPADILEITKKEKVSILDCAPTMIKLMLNSSEFNPKNLPHLQVVITGGSMALPELVQALKERMGCDYINTYAMTEAGIVSRLSPDDPIELQHTTVGKPLNGVEVKIVDDNRNELPLNQPGEIAARTQGLMLGYFNDQVKTDEAIDKDGFYYTGDIGSLDENGYLQILDRKKDMIIRGAQNIFPSEIENYLNTHPKIQMSAVIGVPSPISGEKVRAYVQLFEGEQMTDIEVVEYCRGAIAGYKIPEEVRFVEEFPLNKMGKIQKKVLREEALNG
ncbi:MAG: class I adenylate-forming enzyme family protein [Anaerolineales bacterium]